MDILYSIFIYPIYFMIEVFFWCSYKISLENLLFCIFAVSFLINLVCLPLYIQAEKIQKEENDIQQKLKSTIDIIKRNFKGNERFMLLNTLYRQNNYHPIMSLRASLSLLIQIAFFFGAYTFFSNLYLFQEGFWYMNLAQPDGLLKIFNYKINIFPILMTLINIVSANIYIKNINSKSKIQMYSFALFFLVFLYNSPSGLVIYWIMNNIFSLIKNLGLIDKNPKKILIYVSSYILLMFGIFSVITYKTLLNPFIILCFIIGVISYLIYKFKEIFNKKPDISLFLVSLFSFCILSCLFITINVISSSPLEFTYQNSHSPFELVFNSSFKFLGVAFWVVLLYYLSNKIFRNILVCFCSGLACIQFLNILMYSQGVSLINSDIFINSALIPSNNQSLNFILNIFIFILPLVLIFKNKTKFLKNAFLILIISSLLFSSFGILKIKKELKNAPKEQQKEKNIWFNLSSNGKNVLIIMLDAGMGIYARETFDKTPKLKEKFQGFILYPNTISFYGHTVLGYPALIGGYEYTPYNMNKRKEKMKEKYNEAVLVMPYIFQKNNYLPKIINPKMPDFKFSGDGKKFFEPKGIDTLTLQSTANFEQFKKAKDNFFWFGLFVSLPDFIKKYIVKIQDLKTTNEFQDLTSIPKQMKKMYLPCDTISQYTHLKNLTKKVKIEDTKTNNLVIFHNDFLHWDVFEEDYSKEYYILHQEALRILGEFFDYLRENNSYDNTRIIIVSDHGRHRKKNIYGLNEIYTDYNPILMFKDFSAKDDYKINPDFMTNADTILFATKDIIKTPIKNPLTGKTIENSVDKENIYIITDGDDSMAGRRYSPEDFQNSECISPKIDIYQVRDNIFDDKNWSKMRMTRKI